LYGAELTVGHPEERHVEELGFAMREADKLEVARSTGKTPYEAARLCVDESTVCYAGVINRKLAAIWGVTIPGLIDGHGYPWCLTTPVVDEHPRLFLRGSKFFLRRLVRLCPLLEVDVDAEYTAAIRWLKWLGFEIAEAREFNNAQFCRATFKEVA
jgi:hypothetical protein